MAEERRKRTLDLPMKILFNEEGINFFLQSNKRLSKFKLADEAEQYGIFFDSFSPASVQKMMLINYISYMEISRPEFVSKRQDVMDLSKLITYGTLYRRFDEIVLGKVLDSEVVRKWNRSNPSGIIDRKTSISDSYLAASIEKHRPQATALRQEILRNLIERVRHDPALQAEEKNIQLFLAEKYLLSLRPFTWFILLKFRESEELLLLLNDIEQALTEFMVKAKLAEYLSLMTMELAALAENANIQGFARQRYKGTVDPEMIQHDPEARRLVLEEMRLRNQNIFLSWKVGGETTKTLSSREKLQVRIFNKEGGAGFADLKKTVDDTKQQNVRQRSLLEFYKEGSEDSKAGADLGLYYLSYLSEECQKVGVHFESLVNQIRETNLTVITLNLLF